jgi:hypothetical protein
LWKTYTAATGTFELHSLKGVSGVSVTTAASGEIEIAANVGTLTAAGDVTGTLGATKVEKLLGRTIATTTPVTGNAYVWNGTQWSPRTVATLDTTQTFTKAQAVQSQNLAISGSAATWDLAGSNVGILNLTASVTVGNPAAMVSGGTYILIVKQTGSFTVSWGTAFKWASAKTPVVTTGAGKTTVFSFVCDGTSLYGTASLNY